MSDSVLDELLQRRGVEQEQFDTLKEERLRLATRVALGDADATTRYNELEVAIATKQQTLTLLARAVEGRNLELAEERQAKRDANSEMVAEQRRALEVEYQSAVAERDKICIDQLEPAIQSIVEILTHGVEAGRRIDALRAQLGYPSPQQPQWVQTAREIAQRVRGAVGGAVQQVVPPLGLMFGEGAFNGDPIPSLTNPPPPRSLVQPADHWRPREFAISGPNVRAADSAVLPSPLPTGRSSA